MLERQRAGIARAKTEGKFKGRKPTARAKSDAIMQLHGQGVAAAEIAHRLEISRASVYRVIEDARATEQGVGSRNRIALQNLRIALSRLGQG